jgi:hypothetical protein
MGSAQVLSAVHVAVAVVAVPVSSTNTTGDELTAPLTWFQLLLATTPATSVLAMGTSVPTKLILITFSDGAELVTFSVAVAVCVNVPLVPVIINVELPMGVPVVVATVSVEFPDVVTEVGLNVPVAPAGVPETARPTVPANPFWAATVTV